MDPPKPWGSFSQPTFPPDVANPIKRKLGDSFGAEVPATSTISTPQFFVSPKTTGSSVPLKPLTLSLTAPKPVASVTPSGPGAAGQPAPQPATAPNVAPPLFANKLIRDIFSLQQVSLMIAEGGRNENPVLRHVPLTDTQTVEGQSAWHRESFRVHRYLNRAVAEAERMGTVAGSPRLAFVTYRMLVVAWFCYMLDFFGCPVRTGSADTTMSGVAEERTQYLTATNYPKDLFQSVDHVIEVAKIAYALLGPRDLCGDIVNSVVDPTKVAVAAAAASSSSMSSSSMSSSSDGGRENNRVRDYTNSLNIVIPNLYNSEISTMEQVWERLKNVHGYVLWSPFRPNPTAQPQSTLYGQGPSYDWMDREGITLTVLTARSHSGSLGHFLLFYMKGMHHSYTELRPASAEGSDDCLKFDSPLYTSSEKFFKYFENLLYVNPNRFRRFSEALQCCLYQFGVVESLLPITGPF